MLQNIPKHQQESLLRIIAQVGKMSDTDRGYFLGYAEALASKTTAPREEDVEKKDKKKGA